MTIMTEASNNANGHPEVRRLLLLLIDCVASGGTSQTWGQTTPYLDSLTELRCMWFDDFFHGAEALVSDGIFDADEAKILEQFSTAFRLAYPHGFYPAETNIYRLQDDPTWQSVMLAAKDAQAKLNQLKSRSGFEENPA
jgi:hypothetical protein